LVHLAERFQEILATHRQLILDVPTKVLPCPSRGLSGRQAFQKAQAVRNSAARQYLTVKVIVVRVLDFLPLGRGRWRSIEFGKRVQSFHDGLVIVVCAKDLVESEGNRRAVKRAESSGVGADPRVLYLTAKTWFALI